MDPELEVRIRTVGKKDVKPEFAVSASVAGFHEKFRRVNGNAQFFRDLPDNAGFRAFPFTDFAPWKFPFSSLGLVRRSAGDEYLIVVPENSGCDMQDIHSEYPPPHPVWGL
jgi:hypothetical protein